MDVFGLSKVANQPDVRVIEVQPRGRPSFLEDPQPSAKTALSLTNMFHVHPISMLDSRASCIRQLADNIQQCAF
jgi:hypothetical protein